MKHLALLAVGAMLLLAGCATGGATEDEIRGTWIHDEAQITFHDDGTFSTVDFPLGVLTARGDCGGIGDGNTEASGTWQATGSTSTEDLRLFFDAAPDDPCNLWLERGLLSNHLYSPQSETWTDESAWWRLTRE